MNSERQHHAAVAAEAAERFNELADIAELMDDTDVAALLRHRAASASESHGPPRRVTHTATWSIPHGSHKDSA